MAGPTLENLEVYDFNGPDAVGIWSDNTRAFTERFSVSNVSAEFCNTGLRFSKRGGLGSFEHGHIQVFLSVNAGQTGISVDGGCDLAGGYLEINGNVHAGGTMVHVDSLSNIHAEFGVVAPEANGGKTAGFVVDPPRGGVSLTGMFWDRAGYFYNSAPLGRRSGAKPSKYRRMGWSVCVPRKLPFTTAPRAGPAIIDACRRRFADVARGFSP
ncbi:MAG: hypothetical protein WA005_01335 [Candidatus Binataceae bacterium]